MRILIDLLSLIAGYRILRRPINIAAPPEPDRAALSMSVLALFALPMILAGSGAALAFDGTALGVPGDPQRGRVLIHQYGCGSCHTVPGVNGADGVVGPPLDGMGRRIYVAGMLRNTPENLATWIEKPQQIVPGNVMPNMGISRKQARDIAAYLFTLQ
ncbi:MAG TPA: c-type cytochrome [Xanthobacteraceae bacterium]|jgi:cytochrome c2